MLKAAILKQLHLSDPYIDFVPNPQSALIGWNSDSPVFDDLIFRQKPKLIIEVGTWLGMSALNMAHILKRFGHRDTLILCVDTWLGSVEHWENPEFFGQLKLKNGYPAFYYEFLSNVVKYGFEETILPLPMTSTIAAKFLKSKGIQADLIYIDGSHDFEDVALDLAHYWRLLRPGGVLFGDDFGMPGVEKAVLDFSAKVDLPFCVCPPNKWAFEKPTMWGAHAVGLVANNSVAAPDIWRP